jgi:diguanylate cyclase (GGDEF)-like protein
VIEDRRIGFGVGVLGSVYQSSSPLRVTDASIYPGVKRRSRYRTNSFLALPIVAGSEVLAVVSMTDRADDRAFTRDDLWTLRALAAPATLALSRERAQTAATTYALAAAIDPVSGLFNRRYFQKRIEEELQRAERQQTQVALLMSDLDDFKAINDTYGHAVGDAVIRDIAETLQHSVRLFDVCTRFGGEEFAIVMPGSSAESASVTAERIRQRIEAYRMAVSCPPRITVSVGVAASEPRMTASELILRADQALYVAKRAGRNRVRTFIAEPPAS